MSPMSISPLYLLPSTNILNSLFAPCYHLKPKLGYVGVVGIVHYTGTGEQWARLPPGISVGDRHMGLHKRTHENTGTWREVVVEIEIGVDTWLSSSQ